MNKPKVPEGGVSGGSPRPLYRNNDVPEGGMPGGANRPLSRNGGPAPKDKNSSAPKTIVYNNCPPNGLGEHQSMQVRQMTPPPTVVVHQYDSTYNDSMRNHLMHCCITAFCPIWAFVWLGYCVYEACNEPVDDYRTTTYVTTVRHTPPIYVIDPPPNLPPNAKRPPYPTQKHSV